MTQAARMHKTHGSTRPANPMASLGSAPPGAAPSDTFSPSVPAASFARGGKAGFDRMPHHHDDPSHDVSERFGFSNTKRKGC